MVGTLTARCRLLVAHEHFSKVYAVPDASAVVLEVQALSAASYVQADPKVIRGGRQVGRQRHVVGVPDHPGRLPFARRIVAVGRTAVLLGADAMRRASRV